MSHLLSRDFNYDQIDWDRGMAPGSDNSDIMTSCSQEDLFLYQHVDMLTRFRDGCTPSVLNLIFSIKEITVDNLRTHKTIGRE